MLDDESISQRHRRMARVSLLSSPHSRRLRNFAWCRNCELCYRSSFLGTSWCSYNCLLGRHKDPKSNKHNSENDKDDYSGRIDAVQNWEEEQRDYDCERDSSENSQIQQSRCELVFLHVAINSINRSLERVRLLAVPVFLLISFDQIAYWLV